MLHKFRFSNYRCYADEVVFDLTAMPLKEHKDTLNEINGVGILPVAAFYGANASGKSTFFMAMNRMSSIIVDRYLAQKQNADIKSRVFTSPFMFDKALEDKETLFEATVMIDSYEYRYGFTCNKQTIISEFLFKKKISKNKTIEKNIFFRNSDSLTCGIINKKQQAELEYCFSMSSEKSLMLTDVGMREKDDELSNVFSWFLLNGSSLPMDSSAFCESSFCESFIGNMLNGYDGKRFAKNYKKFIHEIDPSISDIIPTEETDPDGDKYYIAKTLHKYNGQEFTVRISAESEGTKKIMFVSFILFRALEEGLCLFLDELDAKIHPLILQRIIKMFTSKETNPRGAQLVFSAHNLVNFNADDLRRDEIWIVEKTDQKSRIFSLGSCEDGIVRSDLNFSKCYLDGRFGGVPFQKGADK